jgi:hypothetical protein
MSGFTGCDGVEERDPAGLEEARDEEAAEEVDSTHFRHFEDGECCWDSISKGRRRRWF